MEVLNRADTASVEAVTTSSQLRWAGHVCRMSDNRIPKSVFYGEFSSRRRKRDGQKLRFKDVLKRHMKNVDINTQTWEEDAMDRKQ